MKYTSRKTSSLLKKLGYTQFKSDDDVVGEFAFWTNTDLKFGYVQNKESILYHNLRNFNRFGARANSKFAQNLITEAPSLYDVQKYMLETHGISISVKIHEGKFYGSNNWNYDSPAYNDYDEALDETIYQTLLKIFYN